MGYQLYPTRAAHSKITVFEGVVDVVFTTQTKAFCYKATDRVPTAQRPDAIVILLKGNRGATTQKRLKEVGCRSTSQKIDN